MLRMASLFLVLGLAAAVLGFGGYAGELAWAAKVAAAAFVLGAAVLFLVGKGGS
jgi:uncharacterized membrane protein YtjA (UPF0391 family)